MIKNFSGIIVKIALNVSRGILRDFVTEKLFRVVNWDKHCEKPFSDSEQTYFDKVVKTSLYMSRLILGVKRKLKK